MPRSQYAELVALGRMELKEEEVVHNDDQLLVRLTHCGLCQYDGAYYKGYIGEPPVRLGHEPVGIVEAVGANVQGFVPGERVTGLFAHLKSFATYAAADPALTVKVPDPVPSALALGEPLKCIATILRAAPPEYGDHVLVIGCGFMGLLVVAGLASHGLASLIAVDLRPERLDLAQEFGATHALRGDDPDLLKKVKQITGGHGTDVVFEVTGVPQAVETAALTLRSRRGRYALAGWHGRPGTYTLRNWTPRGAEIISAHPAHALDPMDDLRRAMDGLARGVFPMDRLVTHHFPLADVQQAFEAMTREAGGYIKGVIDIAPDLATP
jgi:threonine dehydrogenase-like Zn-dependent dehydrogenase